MLVGRLPFATYGYSGGHEMLSFTIGETELDIKKTR